MNRIDGHRPATDRAAAAVDDAIARVAHQYHVLGLTQADIAKRLGITRFKAHRMLAQARERGMVRIKLDVSSASRLALEDRLVERFGLDTAYVCPSDSTPEFPLSAVIGHYAASIVAPLIADGMTIAVSWGLTLRALAVALEPLPVQNLSVVPLVGSLATRSSIDRYEACSVLAQKLNAECYYLPGPILCDSEATREAISAQPVIRETQSKARAASLALLSIGGYTMSSMFDAGVLSAEDRASAVAAGAVGNLLGYFIGADGRLIDHPLNRRSLGIGPEGIRDVPVRVLCAGGPNKVDAIIGALRNRLVTTLVTDETTAMSVLER
jgi:DNA-binding transcriptional regulator LsrR (DeoR family)